MGPVTFQVDSDVNCKGGNDDDGGN